MRLIDADVLKELILKERDAIPKTFVERYSFGVEIPNSHGNSMRGGIRKALRCMEQTPTIDPESLRPKGKWTENKRTMYSAAVEGDVLWFTYTCSECSWEAMNNSRYCPNCGAKMEG